jgi:tetratricopeptide (TPR) repeat protein
LSPLSVDNIPIATEILTRALKLDPHYPTARAHLAWCHQIRYNDGGLDEADRIAGLHHAQDAIASDVDDATALAVAALVIGILAHDRDAALNAIERGVSVNPSAAAAYFHGAFLYGLWGRSLAATNFAQRALRLSPFDPLAYHAYLALTFAAMQEERYDEAATHGAKLAQASPNLVSHITAYAAALALAGRMEEARSVCARALEIEPTFGVRSRQSVGPAPQLAEKFERGFRLPGLAE